MSKATRSEFTANEDMAYAPFVIQQSARISSHGDTHGASAYDRTGRNALTYRPSLYNARTARAGAFSRIVSSIVNAIL